MMRACSPASAASAKRAGLLTLGLLVSTAGEAPLAAQVRPVAIEGATILTGAGARIERGTLVFQGGKITAVGHAATVPFLTRRIKAEGKYVTPGLIDVSSTLALRHQPDGRPATARAADAFDLYATHELRAAWRAGVTAVYLPAWTANGVGGLGAIARLAAHARREEVFLRCEADLCVALGATDQFGTLARLKSFEELRQQFRAARQYRQAWDDYAEALKQYEQKLAERARQTATQPTSAPIAASPPETDTGKEEAEKELQKPAEPEKNRQAELLLRVLDGQSRLRVRAERSADILNALELADEFNLALIIEGAAGAPAVGDELAARQVPVVLTGPLETVAFAPGARREAQAEAAARLARAGATVFFGSGELAAGEGPNLIALLTRAAGYGFKPGDGLELLTGRAADLLGVGQEIGRLEPGKHADVVIWSADPLSPAAVVERVFVAGHEVYQSDNDQHQLIEEQE